MTEENREDLKKRIAQTVMPTPSIKKMRVLTSNSIRNLVSECNDLQIQREDVVTLVKDNSQYMLVYYK